MRLSGEQEQIILDNLALVHYFVLQRGSQVNTPEYDDMVSIGTYGLIKAALTFDKTKNIKFATYASKVINNEFNMDIRKNRKYYGMISLNAPLNTDIDGNELLLEDVLEAPSSHFDEEVEMEDEITRKIEFVLNNLNFKQRLVFFYRTADINQREVAKIIRISQSYVSRLDKKIRNKLKDKCIINQKYERTFSVSKTENTYQITFKEDYLKKYNKSLDEIIQKLINNMRLPPFKVKVNGNEITVCIYKEPENFIVIAQLLYEIETKE